MQNQDRPIAFFDSGLGGISVLRETVRLLPQENYLYYGDSLHAPYGVRPEAEIRALAGAAAEQLVQAGAKALVVACNTATSAAIVQLREAYPDIPVIGTEPALKPAVEKYPGGRILVMATPMTIRQEKFQALKAQYDDQAEIIGLACGGLMEFVERGELRGEALDAYLFDKVDAIVLGCTHYPFLTGAIRRIVGRGPEILDGSHGVAMQLGAGSPPRACSARRAGQGPWSSGTRWTSRRSLRSAARCCNIGKTEKRRPAGRHFFSEKIKKRLTLFLPGLLYCTCKKFRLSGKEGGSLCFQLANILFTAWKACARSRKPES